jgi:hypothetical protein
MLNNWYQVWIWHKQLQLYCNCLSMWSTHYLSSLPIAYTHVVVNICTRISGPVFSSSLGRLLSHIIPAFQHGFNFSGFKNFMNAKYLFFTWNESIMLGGHTVCPLTEVNTTVTSQLPVGTAWLTAKHYKIFLIQAKYCSIKTIKSTYISL